MSHTQAIAAVRNTGFGVVWQEGLREVDSESDSSGLPAPVQVSAAELAALDTSEVFARLGTPTDGLDEVEASSRLIAHGPNQISDVRGKPLWLDRKSVV